MKKVTILGSTGSIGRSALDVIRQYPDRFKVVGLAAGRNISLLKDQIEEFRPEVVALSDADSVVKLKEIVKIERVFSGPEGVQEVAAYPDADFVLSAISGSAGLLPTFAAIKAGKTIGIANKETLVMAGSLVNEAVKEYGASLLPVDSEHSALFQCMHGHNISEINRLILTASGGPFREKSMKALKEVGPDEALSHPTWQMGDKITIDSATLMNKGLEVIEAHYLFGFTSEGIEVVIHPQSIIHSLVEFRDGTMIAHLSNPDMRSPIAYALSYPERLDGVLKKCNLYAIGSLTFEEPDMERFPCLRLAYEALDMGGTATAVLNAANEMAVAEFLKRNISFTQIPLLIERVLESHRPEPLNDMETVQRADSWAREKFMEALGREGF